MEDWFNVEKIDVDTFVISEYKHWEETHCYLLIGTNHAVLIDTGLGIANIKGVVESITSMPILVATTHVHWDHIGGHKYFKDIAVHENEVEWISGKFPIPLQMVKKNITLKPCDFPDDFEIDNYNVFQGYPTSIIHDGDTIHLGNRKLKVIHTPGHSPGHCCFYEEEKGYLFSGDLLYKGCLYAFYPTTDPFAFMQSVDKIKNLRVKKILPAHHQLNLHADFIDDVANAFHVLQQENKLRQGNGVFDFEDFQIHI